MKKIGTLVEKIKQGETINLRHTNPYLKEALLYHDILYTFSNIEQNNKCLFDENLNVKILEIGCYFGKNIVEMSKEYPNYSIAGIDITYKRCIKTSRKIKNMSLLNARVALCDAQSLFNVLPDNYLDGVCVFFPDPWPKKRHEKNRLIQENFLSLIYPKLKANAFFWFKTDCEIYMTEIVSAVQKNSNLWQMSAIDEQPAELNKQKFTTVFEELFTNQQQSIYKRYFRTLKKT